MSAPAYLLDQNMDPAIAASLLQMEPSIGVQFVGQRDAPPFGTHDAELLNYAESNSFILVTFDKKTMPNHIADHLKSSRHTSGVFIFANSRLPPGRIAEELLLIWATSTAEEWIDQTLYLPL
jgi:hypothetical protein